MSLCQGALPIIVVVVKPFHVFRLQYKIKNRIILTATAKFVYQITCQSNIRMLLMSPCLTSSCLKECLHIFIT